VVTEDLENRASALVCQGVQDSVHAWQCTRIGT
jgi:hypothetical protein